MSIPRAASIAALAAAFSMVMAAAAMAAGSPGNSPPAALSAEQIVDKCVAVRGGSAAWNKIATITWEGHLESERSPVPSLPFQVQESGPTSPGLRSPSPASAA